MAIRTILIDRRNGQAEYGAGGGIVWDSDIDAEMRESVAKTRILRPSPRFDLLETMRWAPDSGYRLLRLHLNRLVRSAEYFGFGYRAGAVHRELRLAADNLPRAPHRIRLLVSPSGAVNIEASPLDPDWAPPVRIGLALESVRTDDRFLYHKTTHRGVYEAARADRTEYGEVLLANERGEITEATIANVAVELDGGLWTPPMSSGLLPGTWREWLIGRGELRERAITADDLTRAKAVWLCNSVRGMWRVKLE